MTVNSMADAENSRTLRERLLKTLPDQTSLDSFFIDYFPEVKRNRFTSISNREDQINKIVETAGLQALQIAFEHYLRKTNSKSTPNKSNRRIKAVYCLAGVIGAMIFMIPALYRLLSAYHGLQRAVELQSSCNKGNDVNCNRLVQYYQNRCESRSWDDCVNLGDYHWLQQNKGEAYRYYKIACDQEQLSGCYYMAMIIEKGDGVPIDENLAKIYYERVCNKKFDRACVRLGDMYWQGRAVSRDPRQAFRLYRTACEQDNATGCYRLGQMYETGDDGVSKDVSLSYQHYDRSCNRLGYSYSCLRLGLLYYTQKIQDSGNVLAQRAFEKACAQGAGELDACVNLGRIFEDGANGQKHLERAIAEYKNACDRKHAGGCTNLGLLYSRPNSPHYNIEQALALLKSSCEANLDLACYNYAAIWFKARQNQATQAPDVLGNVTTPTLMLLNSCRHYYWKACALLGELALSNQIERESARGVLELVCTTKQERPVNSGCEAWIQIQFN